MLGNILRRQLRPDKEEVHETLILRVLGNIEAELRRLTPAEREAYSKFLKQTAPHLFAIVTRKTDFTPIQVWNGPVDPFNESRPAGGLLIGEGLLTKAGLETQLMLLDSANLGANSVYSTLASIVAWPSRKVGNFSADLGHVAAAALYGKKGEAMDELLHRFPRLGGRGWSYNHKGNINYR
ncbi:hypothetical protein U27_02209 [Candidatus Vecturithrix granuli]|uniref:Uncharacterized protein n=1 Tax=Vecturithrix granuli TaxID=1499967 RepID=A0A0S6W6T6_VECG1|nr:hypothetical protein U27_02209 [Candidatus Vecturithrix granuli]